MIGYLVFEPWMEGEDGVIRWAEVIAVLNHEKHELHERKRKTWVL
jgi:hypothetical protein